jgi:hypothetical protein
MSAISPGSSSLALTKKAVGIFPARPLLKNVEKPDSLLLAEKIPDQSPGFFVFFF